MGTPSYSDLSCLHSADARKSDGRNFMLNKSRFRGMTPRFSRARIWPLYFGFLVGGLAGGLPASELDQLKRLSIDELMEIEVTSVSRSPVAFGEAPSAVQIITDQEIRRSGASSLPEALRLANNLHIARKNSHDWGIAARGFNTELSN